MQSALTSFTTVSESVVTQADIKATDDKGEADPTQFKSRENVFKELLRKLHKAYCPYSREGTPLSSAGQRE